MCGPRHCNEATSWEALTAGKIRNFCFATLSYRLQNSDTLTGRTPKHNT